MKEIPGNIVDMIKDFSADVFVQGCNCYCTQGAGVAGALRVFPQILEADTEMGRVGDATKLGDYSVARVTYYEMKETNSQGQVETIKVDLENPVFVINAYTQHSYDPKGKPLDIPALRKVFARIKKDYAGLYIAYPEIGCGLGGGKWEEIAPIIDEELANELHFLIKWVPSV